MKPDHVFITSHKENRKYLPSDGYDAPGVVYVITTRHKGEVIPGSFRATLKGCPPEYVCKTKKCELWHESKARKLAEKVALDYKIPVAASKVIIQEGEVYQMNYGFDPDGIPLGFEWTPKGILPRDTVESQ